MYNFLIGLALVVITALPQVGPVPALSKKVNDLVATNLPKTESPKNTTAAIGMIPERISAFSTISAGSKAALFVDFDSGEVLYSKNEKQKLPMASITKLMTALIAEEFLNMNKVITVQQYTLRPLDSVMGIPAGTTIKVGELMHGLLIESGADAAQAIAKEVSGNEQKFVALMNERASFYGLSNTQFTNSVGYDDSGHYSTAEDLIKLARIALLNKNISDIIKKQKYIATAEDGQKFYLENTNKLLDGTNFVGLKTGTTLEAGECLVVLYQNGNQKIIGVVLNSLNRFGETKGIIEWAKSNFIWPAPAR